MKKRYFIMQLYHVGNIGDHQIEKIKDQPKDGFYLYDSAEEHLVQLLKKGGWPFDSTKYNFTILPIYTLNK